MRAWDCSMTTGSDDIGHYRKQLQLDRSHNPGPEACRSAQCGKSARCVRSGGGWKRSHGSPYPGTKGETPETDKGNPTDHRASPRPYRDAVFRRRNCPWGSPCRSVPMPLLPTSDLIGAQMWSRIAPARKLSGGRSSPNEFPVLPAWHWCGGILPGSRERFARSR